MTFILLAAAVLLAWMHARITVVSVILNTASPEHMLHLMNQEVYWVSVAVVLVNLLLPGVAPMINFFCTMRYVFLFNTRWQVICDHYYDLKKLAP